jgi:hypothetical protein
VIISVKYKRKPLSWLECHLYLALHFPFTPGAPCKCVPYTSMRAVSTAKGMVFLPVGLTHSEKLPLHHGHLITKCWVLVHWMLRGPVAGVTPLVRLQILPPPQRCRSELLLYHLLSQTSSDIRFGVSNLAFLSSALMTDCWLRNKYTILLITQLEQVVTNWNAILFHLFCGSNFFYRPFACLFLFTKCTVEIITRSGRHIKFSIRVMKCVSSQYG